MLEKRMMPLATMTSIALIALAPSLTVAQQTESGEHQQGSMHSHMSGTSAGAEGMPEPMMNCQQMQEKMQKMQAKREQMQAELEELAAKMNSASGKEQQELMAQLLNELVERTGAMNGMMSQMHPMMMQHMMGHMQAGGMGEKGTMGGMSGCPMMDHAKSVPTAGDDHPEHH